MKCSKCGGEIKHIEEVCGTYVSTVNYDGSINRDDFYGDSYSYLECSNCKETYDHDLVGVK